MNFAALGSGNFRTYFFGNMFALNASWMQRVTLGWLAWDLTDAAGFVGIVAVMQFLPTVVLGAVLRGSGGPDQCQTRGTCNAERIADRLLADAGLGCDRVDHARAFAGPGNELRHHIRDAQSGSPVDGAPACTARNGAVGRYP